MKQKLKAIWTAFCRWHNGLAFWLAWGILFSLLACFHPKLLEMLEYMSHLPDGCFGPYTFVVVAAYCFGSLCGCSGSK